MNQGQTAAHVDFLSRGERLCEFLTPTETVLSLQKSAPAAGDGPRTPARPCWARGWWEPNPSRRWSASTGLPAGAIISSAAIPASGTLTSPTTAPVECRNLYPGVDLVYHGNQRQLEYDYVVVPGTDPGVIKLAIDGAESMTIDGQGNLVLHTSGGDVLESAPVVYQESGGVRQPVSGQFVLAGTARSASPWVPTTTPNRWSSIRS